MRERYRVDREGQSYDLTDQGAPGGPAQARLEPAAGGNVVRYRVTPPAGGQAVDVFLPPQGPVGLGAAGYGAGNPILFPFPNRVRGGRYTFEGQGYQLDVNEPGRQNHIHGLVANAPWRVEGHGADSQGGSWVRAAVDLGEGSGVARGYPFPCRLAVTTRLHEGALTQEIAVQNTGTGRLPMGFGTHPWFPATLGDAREATLVRVPGERYWRLNDLVPTGETVPVEEQGGRMDLRAWRALDGLDLDDVYTAVVRRPDGWSEAGIRYPDAGLEVRVEAGPEFREWVIYAPTQRAVICLEPYTGTTDAVNLQPKGVDAGLIVLEPGATWRGTIRTSLRRAEG
jgi:aldose 1-epimerase